MWDEVRHRLKDSALELNPGQQQRLCIARAIAVKPEVILMDEPCSALDPVATMHIEELMRQLALAYTIVIVTHNMQQAARASHWTGFFCLGRLVEFNETGGTVQFPTRGIERSLHHRPTWLRGNPKSILYSLVICNSKTEP